MGWLETKQKARQVVHNTMALPAQFRPQSGGAIDGTARLHYKVRTFGDLDREGFATVTEAVDYIIIDTRIFVGADESDRVFFPQLNRAFKLDVRGEAEDDIFVKWEVSEVAP
jgi:hypothetical protein